MKCTMQDLEYDEKSEDHGERETHTVGYGIWRETVKKLKNETQTLFHLEYGEKPSKTCKMRIHSVGPGLWQETVKNVKKKKYTLQDLYYRDKLKNVPNQTQTLYDQEYGKKH